MRKSNKLVASAFYLALCQLLPLVTGQIPQVGSMLLPMHIPVFICGLLCGWNYGLMVGFIAPLLRFFLFGMPPFLTAFAMAFELAAYGSIAGGLYQKFHHHKWRIYLSLIPAMFFGRIIWGIVSIFLYGVNGASFTWQIFISGALLNAVPGIFLQILLIPALIFALEKTGATEHHDNSFTKTPDTLS